MKITALLENISKSNEFKNKHGLSFYIETKGHKILMDLGPDDSFIFNAKKLGIDLAKVDTVVISHGHGDHGGGLKSFLEINQDAKIYVRENIFDEYYVNLGNEYKFIGLDKKLKESQQIVFVKDKDYFEIDKGLWLFSDLKGEKYLSSANKALFKKDDEEFKEDGFFHEQCLVVEESGNQVLLGGCAHSGIINILDKFVKRCNKTPNYIISGLHLYNPDSGISEKEDLILSISDELCKLNIELYTCHCTGIYPFSVLERELGAEKIKYFYTGMCIEI